MDEVELAPAERPVPLGVVDQELAVRRHEGGLHGREVGADDVRVRVRVGEGDRPRARAAADVEDGVEGGAGERGEVEGVVGGHEPHHVLEVQPGLFEGVVGEVVCWEILVGGKEGEERYQCGVDDGVWLGYTLPSS